MGENTIIDDLIAVVTDGDLFTRDEAMALIGSVTADSPDDLPGNIEKVIMWARGVRGRQAILEVILQMGSAQAIDVRPGDDGEVSMRLNLDPSEVAIK